MGLDLSIYSSKEGPGISDLSMGYSQFHFIKMFFLRRYKPELNLHEKYKKWLFSHPHKDEFFYEVLYHVKDSEPLSLLVSHSDCDGNLTWKESRAMYKELKSLDFSYDDDDVPYTLHGGGKPTNLIKGFMDMLLFSWKNRSNIYFD